MVFSSQTFLSLTLIALSVADASPLTPHYDSTGTLPFTTRFNINAKSRATIPELDRARVRGLKRASRLGRRSGTSVDITNKFVNYVAQVGVGDPAHNYTLLIDTGSSNTWVGADSKNPYVQTSTSINTGNHFNETYGSGSVDGEEWFDTVTLGPELVITNQSIGVAHTSKGLDGLDGIIGVGPIDLTTNTVSNTHEVPTVMDNLYSQGAILEEVLGVYFIPSDESGEGELTFGDYDDSVITGPVNYVPLTTTSPASGYWGVNLTISYGDQTLSKSRILLSNVAGIVDTGTTLITIATDAFQQYQTATGAVMDNSTGLLSINSTAYNNLQTLSFNIGGTSYDLTPNAQTWPRSLNSDIGGDANGTYLVVSDIGNPSGSGLDFTLGFTFLQRFYSVYDTTNQQVGFATTSYTNSNSN